MGSSGPDTNLFVVDNLDVARIVQMARNGHSRHVVQNNQLETSRETLAARMIQNSPQDFFKYPMVTTLNPQAPSDNLEESLTMIERKFSTLSEKEPILSEIAALMDEARLNRSLRDDIVMTANEFACNVLFNAPCVLGVNSKDLRSTLKSAQLQLNQPATLKVGAYQGYLAVSCLDYYGSLQPTRILDRLEKCAVLGAGESINLDDSGTAGIGCYMVLRAATSFYMGVKQNEMTQFCAIFPQISRAKDRDAKNKNLHWFTI